MFSDLLLLPPAGDGITVLLQSTVHTVCFTGAHLPMLVQLLAFVQQAFARLLYLYSGCYANIFIFILFGDLMP